MQKENDLISDIKENFGSLMNARSLAVSNDKRILEFLLESSKLKAEYKERFFETHCGALIFKKDDFLNFLDLKLLSASYTRFSNKIGIGTSEKKFLKNTENVVLNYPFKDCVLKGGQKSDDEKSTEIFFNNILAKSEIDVLFSPKVLCNFELISTQNTADKSAPACHSERSPSRHSERSEESKSIEFALKNNPNLLIKGNNLIALHCLKYKYAKQVKLIYIDPPYNTGNDSFNYNDRFNHSTYLCFMKNRLEIARELLRDDGVIFVQCDDNEQAYLKVLMDEIFGRENFVESLPRITKKAGKSTDTISKNHDYILLYKKQFLSLSQLEVDEDNYPLKDEFFDERGGYKLSQTLDYDSLQYSTSMDYEAEINGVKFYAGGYEKWLDRQKGQHKKIDWVWRWSKDKLEFGLANGFVEVKGSRIYTKTYLNATISKSKPYVIEKIKRGKNLSSIEFVENQYSNDMASKNIQQVFNEKNLFNYSKPEALLQRIIEISTNENDLVLDFFAGSGTTLAVAHKMKRKYIGIEQMEYIESITKERLKKVIDGESGGISKAVEWSGGGSFIYCELAPLNASFIEKIENSRDENELNNIYKDLQKLAFIDYRVDIQNDLKDSEFGALSFEEKKRILKKCLDRNMDYIPYADMEDSEYKIDEQTRILNDIFYKKVEMI